MRLGRVDPTPTEPARGRWRRRRVPPAWRGGPRPGVDAVARQPGATSAVADCCAAAGEGVVLGFVRGAAPGGLRTGALRSPADAVTFAVFPCLCGITLRRR